jgi:Superinfection immunity protein
MVRAFLILTFLAALFMPLIIAALYKLPRQGAIAVLSLVFFWTGVGWVAAFFIAIGGAIRATRPPLAGQEQPLGPATTAPAYTPAQTRASAAASERAQAPQRATAPERPQPPQRSPWPDSSR